MTKKLLVLTIAVMMAAGAAYASDLKGKVTAVDGNKVTIEVQTGKASDVSVGDVVEVEVKKEEKKAAPAKGRDRLMGC